MKTLIVILMLSTGVLAQSRADVGFIASGSSNLGYNGASIGGAFNGLFRSSRLAFAPSLEVVRAHKYDGAGSAIGGRGLMRYYLNRTYFVGGGGFAHQTARTFTSNEAAFISGVGFDAGATTAQVTFELASGRHKTKALRFDVERIVAGERTYLTIRPFATIVFYSQSHEATGHPEIVDSLRGVRVGLTIGIGRKL